MGGWAAIAYGLPRTTLDVDLYINPSPKNVQTLIKALSKVGFGIARELTPEEILAGSVFRFADQIRIDIITRLPGLDSFESCHARRWTSTLDTIAIPYLSIDDLIRTKDTTRPQDRADLEALRHIAKRFRK